MPRAMDRPSPAPPAGQVCGRFPPERHVEDAGQIPGGIPPHASDTLKCATPAWSSPSTPMCRRRGCAYRVDYQVADCPPELRGIDVQGMPGTAAPVKPDPLGPCHRLSARENLGDQIVEPTGRGAPERPGVNPELEQVVDHDGEAVHLRRIWE